MAKIISPKSTTADSGMYEFTKKITIENDNNFKVKIYASLRYILYINDEYICEGPCRSHEDIRYFDEISTSALKKGENEIKVIVLHLTNASHFTSAFKTIKPQLIIDINSDKENYCTDSTWNCYYLKNHKLLNQGLCFTAPYEEIINNDKELLEIEEILNYDFDKGMGFTYGKIETPVLCPRPIPMIYPGKEINLVPVKKGDGFIEFDAGMYITAKLSFNIKKNSYVKIIYSECYESENGKVKRDDTSGILNGYFDIIHPQKEDFTFTPFWFRSFRYIRIETENPDETVISLCAKKCHYPLEITGEFSCSDKNFNLMNEISINTMLCCMHEIFVDCPFYEQQQYIMDSAIEANVLMRMSSDTRMIKKCIEEFAVSQHPSGLLSANYPCSHTQIIPGFSFFWVLMLKDYIEYSNDIDFAKSYIGVIEKIFNYFENTLNDEGLITLSDGWDFVDWVPNWKDGVPQIRNGEALTIYNLYYACALKSAEFICNLTGKVYLANEYNRRHKILSERIIKYCYDSEKNMFRDGSHTNEFSMHTIIWSVLSEVITDEKAKEIIIHLFDEDILKSSFSMNFYLFRALEKAECYDFAFEFLNDWQKMIDMHCTTWCENPDSPRSECHGWSSAPLYEFSANILGVKFFTENCLEISPVPGSLSYAKGTVPTRLGNIRVEWNISNGIFTINIITPEGINKKIYLPNGEVIISDETQAEFKCLINK